MDCPLTGPDGPGRDELARIRMGDPRNGLNIDKNVAIYRREWYMTDRDLKVLS